MVDGLGGGSSACVIHGSGCSRRPRVGTVKQNMCSPVNDEDSPVDSWSKDPLVDSPLWWTRWSWWELRPQSARRSRRRTFIPLIPTLSLNPPSPSSSLSSSFLSEWRVSSHHSNTPFTRSSNHRANIEQLENASCTCILNAFAGCLLDDCSMFAFSKPWPKPDKLPPRPRPMPRGLSK